MSCLLSVMNVQLLSYLSIPNKFDMSREFPFPCSIKRLTNMSLRSKPPTSTAWGSTPRHKSNAKSNTTGTSSGSAKPAFSSTTSSSSTPSGSSKSTSPSTWRPRSANTRQPEPSNLSRCLCSSSWNLSSPPSPPRLLEPCHSFPRDLKDCCAIYITPNTT